ncbi:hypothetical protein ACOMHN_016216 [Nucella lapillus]
MSVDETCQNHYYRLKRKRDRGLPYSTQRSTEAGRANTKQTPAASFASATAAATIWRWRIGGAVSGSSPEASFVSAARLLQPHGPALMHPGHFRGRKLHTSSQNLQHCGRYAKALAK